MSKKSENVTPAISLERIVDIASEQVLPCGKKISSNEKLNSYGADSLDLVEIVIEIQKEAKVRILDSFFTSKTNITCEHLFKKVLRASR